MNFLTNKRTLSKLILSYIAVLVIPLVFGISLYYTTLDIYRKDVDDANLQVLDNVRDSVNVNLSGISTMMQALFNESNVITLSNKENYINFDYISMSSLQKKVSMSLLSNSYIDEILVYFHKSDCLLTSRDYLNDVKKMTGYSNTVGLTIPEFVGQLNRKSDFDLRILSSERGNKAFLVACDGINNSRGYLPNTTIMVRLKPAALAKLMESEHCQTFLVDESGNSLSGGGSSSLVSRNGTWALDPDDSGSRLIESADPTFALSFIRFIPDDIYSKNLSQLQLLAVVFVLLCVALGIPLAIFIARHTYDPIRKILSIIPYSPEGRDPDDYKVISNSISGLLQRNKMHEVERDSRSVVMRNYLFYRLLDDTAMEGKDFLAECRKCQVDFDNTAFLMVGFLIENGSNLFFEKDETANEEMFQLLFIAITNILRETLGGEYRFFTAEYKDGYYALVNVDSRLDKAVAAEEIRACCEQLTDRLDTDFRALVSAAVSNIHSGSGEIRRCYEEVREIIRQEEMAKRSAYVVQYREITSRSAAARESRIPSAPRKESGKHSSIQDICAYLDENYSNADLTVGAVSEHFDMTTANLSLYFKRKMGVSPLEYIQLKRVREAKRLIDTTQNKITDIAKAVGYYDTRPLIRSFKRIEGITPAEYRDLPRQPPTGGC